MSFESPYAPIVDPYFAQLGFQSETSGMRRAFAGEIDGRAYRVRMHPQRRTKYHGDIRTTQYLGHHIHIDTPIRARTRCGVFRRAVLRPWSTAIKRWVGARPLDPMPEALHDLACWGFEPGWAGRWFAVPGTQETLLALFTPETSPHVHSISAGPHGRLSLVIHHADVRRLPSGRYGDWMAALRALAECADRAPPPVHALAPTRLELFIERHPMAAGVGLMLALMLVLGVAGLIFSAAMFGLAVLLRL